MIAPIGLVISIAQTSSGLDRYLSLHDSWPLPMLGVETRCFSSFDRTGGNDDGFRGTHSVLYRDHNGEHVIFDAEGPGCLTALWFTSNESGHAKLNFGRLRIYFDGELKPSITIEANDLFAGKTAPFLKPFVFDNQISTGGYVSFVPLAYSGSLRITTERRASFYIAQYDTFPSGTPIDSGAVRQGKWPEPKSRGLMHIPLRWKHNGASVIERIVYKPAEVEPANRWIKIWWDGADTPAIDCPLDMFFGSGLDDTRMESLAFAMEKGAWENRIPMPFWKSAKIEVSGSGELAIQLGKQTYASDKAGTLHATYRNESPTSLGKDFLVLNQSGAGKLIATVLTVRPPSPTAKGWWEGDTRTLVDGKRTPNYHGTGHEDDHFGGWSNEFLDAPFTLPMHGEPKVEVLNREGQVNGNCTMYRLWHGIGFVNGISHSVEHGNENAANFNYSATTFWYQFPTLSCDKTDEIDICSEPSRKEHRLTVQNETEIAELSSAFEGALYRKMETGKTRNHLNQLSFHAVVIPTAEGLLLRRQYDQFQGRQRARVLIDDKFVGWWYSPCENRILRWAEGDFFIPKQFIAGKQKIKITLDPPAGSPLWNASKYEVFCISKGK